MGVFPPNTKEILQGVRRADWNTEKHHDETPLRKLIYTSSSSLSTTAGTRWYAPCNGEFVSIRFNVTAIGATNTDLDMLLNGNSVFIGAGAGVLRPQLFLAEAPTNRYSRKFYVFDRGTFAEDDYVQFQLNATGGATGPMVVTVEWKEVIDT